MTYCSLTHGLYDRGTMITVRSVVTAAAVCVTSWIGLLIGAGNVGLQRSVAVGSLTLFEAPAALVLAFVTSLAVALLLAPVGSRWPLTVAGIVLIGDLIGSTVLAPLAVGELSVLDAHLVFVPLTALGLQPLGAAIGAYLRPALAPRRSIRA